MFRLIFPVGYLFVIDSSIRSSPLLWCNEPELINSVMIKSRHYPCIGLIRYSSDDRLGIPVHTEMSSISREMRCTQNQSIRHRHDKTGHFCTSCPHIPYSNNENCKIHHKKFPIYNPTEKKRRLMNGNSHGMTKHDGRQYREPKNREIGPSGTFQETFPYT